MWMSGSPLNKRAMPVWRLALALLFALGFTGSAAAAEPVTVRIEGWWGGLRAAEMLLTVDQEARTWTGDIVIHTAGFVHWLTGLMIDAHGHGRSVGTTGDLPDTYTQHVVSFRSDRTVELGFTGDPATGRRVHDKEVFSDASLAARDAENVPDLPETQRQGTMDPIAAVLTLGRRAIAGDRKFTLPVYDGRRRFDLAVEILGHAKHGLNGHPTETIDAVAIVHPIGGFKPYHLRR